MSVCFAVVAATVACDCCSVYSRREAELINLLGSDVSQYVIYTCRQAIMTFHVENIHHCHAACTRMQCGRSIMSNIKLQNYSHMSR